MVQVWKFEEVDWSAQDKAVPLIHSEPLHRSFGWLVEQGFAVCPIPTAGLTEGATLVLPPCEQTAYPEFGRLVNVVDRLLGPGGCPWDREQTHESLKKYLIEEAYEVIEAIDARDNDELKVELGDLLLQPLMHAQMEAQDGRWTIEDVAKGVADKLVYRHPHVFGDTSVANSEEVLRNWDKLKKAEKEGKTSILDGIPSAMPALTRAQQISVRAARSGFEWPDVAAVREKVDEELRELDEALASGKSAEIEAELGDLLFTLVNLARWQKIDAEECLRKMLSRFTSRFKAMESLTDQDLSELSAEKWEGLWQKAKRAEAK